MCDCVFCDIVAGKVPATILERWEDAIAIMPLKPVVDGHMLIIPNHHMANYMTNPDVSAVTMFRAAEYAADHMIGPSNIITSAGREATQSVFHLHLHIVPRHENDGLALPWYSGKTRAAAKTAAAEAERERGDGEEGSQ